MSSQRAVEVVTRLAEHGLNADREAVTLLSQTTDLAAVIDALLARPDAGALRVTAADVKTVLGDGTPPRETSVTPEASSRPDGPIAEESGVSSDVGASENNPPASSGTAVQVTDPVTGHSTGTGVYDDFVAVFRDRYDRLSEQLAGRVPLRTVDSVRRMSGGAAAALTGLVSDIRSTRSGHTLIELEDNTGVFPCLVNSDREAHAVVDELVLDEVISITGRLASDGDILFADAITFPDIPRTFTPPTAEYHAEAVLISDVHVGSQEFHAAGWDRFTEWLHTDEAERIEALLIAGDMIEGVGVYPGQDDELEIVDVYDQYRRFSELLKQVPGELEIAMIPGNHDAVRLAEPQPAFTDELRSIMTAHDATVTANPSTVTVAGVPILMYHGVSLDELIAELPAEKASYDDPQLAMAHLLKKRHLAPQYGGRTRLAPERRDHLVIDAPPAVFHTGHVHKTGWGKYHNVLMVNAGCWQRQTDFQRSVNIDPDVGYAPIVDLRDLSLTVRKFV